MRLLNTFLNNLFGDNVVFTQKSLFHNDVSFCLRIVVVILFAFKTFTSYGLKLIIMKRYKSRENILENTLKLFKQAMGQTSKYFLPYTNTAPEIRESK
jgi:hypothetical protein